MKCWRKLMFWFHRERFDRELAEEMRLHVDLRAERLRGQGVDGPEAQSAARRSFGDATILRESSREVRTWRAVEEITQDLRYAFRTLREYFGFAAAVVVCLAAGIGTTTAFYSVLQHVVLRPFPYADSERVAIAWSPDTRLADGKEPVSFLDWQDWQQRAHTFAGLAAFRNRPAFIALKSQSLQIELHQRWATARSALHHQPQLPDRRPYGRYPAMRFQEHRVSLACGSTMPDGS